MKTPRLLLLTWALLPLAPASARAGDTRPITINLGDQDFQAFGPGDQDGRNWIALIPQQPLINLRDLTSRNRIAPADNTRVVLLKPVDMVSESSSRFMIPRLSLTLSRQGTVDVFEYTTTPPPALRTGQLLRVRDRTAANGAPLNFVLDDGPIMILDPRAEPAVTSGNGGVLLLNNATLPQSGDDLQFWNRRALRVDNAGSGSRLLVGGANTNPLDQFDLRNLFRRPGSNSGLDFLNLNAQEPTTIYPIMSGYKYDPVRHKLIGPDGIETDVTEGQIPGRFRMAPAILRPGSRADGVVLVNNQTGREVKPETPVQTRTRVAARTNVPMFAGWKETVTDLSRWRDVQTNGQTHALLHCYHPGLVNGTSLKATIAANRAPNIVPCVTWSPAPGDKVEDGEGDKKFKYRKLEITAGLDIDGDKLVVIGLRGETGNVDAVELVERMPDADRFAPATAVMVVEVLPPPVVENWKDVVTPLSQWRRLEIQDADKTPLFCWIGMLRQQKDSLYESIEKNGLYGIHTCVQWKALTPDEARTEGGVKYRVREVTAVNYINIDKATKKIQLQRGKIEAIQRPFDAAAFAPATAVMASFKPAADAPAAGLSEKEKLWLTRSQRADYVRAGVFTRAAAAEYRARIAVNLEPDAAAARYATTSKDAASTQKALDDLLPAQVWGGDPAAVREVVAESGTKTDVQLSEAELKALEADPAKYEAALSAYRRDRGTNDGNVSSVAARPAFGAENYDPIALHLATMAARNALPKAETPAAPAEPARLNPLQLSLLTPLERQVYFKTYLEPADQRPVVPGAEASLQRESDRLRGLIKSQNRVADKPFAVPADVAAFNAMPAWHKTMFCDPKQAGAAAAASDAGNGAFAPGSDALKALQEIDQQRVAAERAAAANLAAQSGKSLPDWAKGPCAQFLGNPAAAPSNAGNNGNGGDGKPPVAVAKLTTGDDKENVDKKPSPLMNKDLAIASLKGALLGLLIGSLFGPVGLIMGPIIGAALYWGAAKDAMDKDK